MILLKNTDFLAIENVSLLEIQKREVNDALRAFIISNDEGTIHRDLLNMLNNKGIKIANKEDFDGSYIENYKGLFRVSLLEKDGTMIINDINKIDSPQSNEKNGTSAENLENSFHGYIKHGSKGEKELEILKVIDPGIITSQKRKQLSIEYIDESRGIKIGDSNLYTYDSSFDDALDLIRDEVNNELNQKGLSLVKNLDYFVIDVYNEEFVDYLIKDEDYYCDNDKFELAGIPFKFASKRVFEDYALQIIIKLYNKMLYPFTEVVNIIQNCYSKSPVKDDRSINEIIDRLILTASETEGKIFRDNVRFAKEFLNYSKVSIETINIIGEVTTIRELFDKLSKNNKLERIYFKTGYLIDRHTFDKKKLNMKKVVLEEINHYAVTNNIDFINIVAKKEGYHSSSEVPSNIKVVKPKFELSKLHDRYLIFETTEGHYITYVFSCEFENFDKDKINYDDAVGTRKLHYNDGIFSLIDINKISDLEKLVKEVK